MKVVGFKSVTAKKDGTKYVEIHFLSEDRYVTGMRCDSIFVRCDMVTNIECLTVDSDIIVSYNRFGRPDSVTVL